MNENPKSKQETSSYEAPQVESVITPQELEREVAYAGVQTDSAPA